MPPRPVAPVETVAEVEDTDDGPATNDEPPTGKGRGAARSDRAKSATASKAVKKPKGRTIYLPDDLFERVVVQSLRRNMTISEYVARLLERQVPDHRTIRADHGNEAGAT